jgi:Na+-driven multidrug efflux pump
MLIADSEKLSLHRFNVDKSTNYTELPSQEDGLRIEMIEHTHTYEPNIDIIKKICLSSYPICFSLVFEIAGTFIALAFASRVKAGVTPTYVIFAGISLANMYANVSCFSVLEGMSAALETLGSQYNGAEDYRSVGIVFMRCVVVLTLLTIPLMVTWMYVAEVFRYLGVDDSVCEVVASYLQVL